MGDELTVESIIDDARAHAGVDDVGDEWFLGPLSAWVTDLRGDNLTDSGRSFLRRLAVNDVVRRLEVLDTIRQRPEILDVEIPPIVHITGLERSGTTILHNLLALHADLRPVLRWELMRPVPPPTTDGYIADGRIARVQASIEPLRGTLLERMHWVNADEPEECVWGFLDATGMLGQGAGACMPTWWEFLRGNDLTPTFEHHRWLLQLLTWRHPVPPGGRLVLKAPQISNELATFAAVFPEARFVVTDRDPFRCLTSMMVLGASMMDAFCVENPVRNPVEGGHDWVGTTGDRLAAIADFGDAHPERLTHLSYPALAQSPRAALVDLARQLGLRDDPEFGPSVDTFIDGQRAGKRAAPPTELDPMIGEGEVWSDRRIADYCARFGIVPETRRLTGAS